MSYINNKAPQRSTGNMFLPLGAHGVNTCCANPYCKAKGCRSQPQFSTSPPHYDPRHTQHRNLSHSQSYPPMPYSHSNASSSPYYNDHDTRYDFPPHYPNNFPPHPPF